MSEEKLSALLERPAKYHQVVLTHSGSLEPIRQDRFVVSFQAGLLSIEHATAS
jgi:hypothetical protein